MKLRFFLFIFSILIGSYTHLLHAEDIILPSKQIALDGIKAIRFENIARITWLHSPENTITIKGTQEDILDTKVSKDTGIINITYSNSKKYSQKSKLEIIVKTNSATALTLSNVAHFIMIGKYTIPDFSCNMQSTAHADFNLQCTNFLLNTSASADISVLGRCSNANINALGVACMDFKDFMSDHVSLTATGCSKVYAHAEKSLDIKANGIAKLYYAGDFAINEIQLSGIAQIEKMPW